ncbi:hypothetical protein IWW35_001363 [Coemansia sp. RSA 1878]|nr:hypothetical protein IWW35_001363 [Coemansia sp. RSA 1878]
MDREYGRRNRRATISCTMVGSRPLSDYEQADVGGQTDGGWQAQSWITMTWLPQRLGTYLSPRFRRRSIGHIAMTSSPYACCCGDETEYKEKGVGCDMHSDHSNEKGIVHMDHSNKGCDLHSVYSAAWESENADSKTRQLMTVFQIPAFMVEAHILGSYRPLCHSVRECIMSWRYVHTELGNIMTHMAGLLVFIGLALVTGPAVIPAVAPSASAADYAVIYTYIAAVLFCLAASSAFHTLACHSQHKHFRALRCDFIGILVLIVGSFVPIGYYGFLNAPRILVGYMAMFVFIGIVGVAVSIVGHVEDPRRARWRPIIFMGISGAGLVPIVHGAVLNGYAGAVDKMSLWYVVAMIMLYIVGTVIYAFKLPERYRPGKHDVLLHSHQIFHVFVVLAAILHYIGIVRALDWAHAATN